MLMYDLWRESTTSSFFSEYLGKIDVRDPIERTRFLKNNPVSMRFCICMYSGKREYCISTDLVSLILILYVKDRDMAFNKFRFFLAKYVLNVLYVLKMNNKNARSNRFS